MKEIKAIINAYDKIDWQTTKAALATVVRVEGSSYRRSGARMLVLDNGVWIGGISGGCLEGDALKQARFSIVKSSSTLVTYDTTENDPYQIGVGLGCNGIIDVLFTPLDFRNKKNPVEILKSCLQTQRQTQVVITITGLKGEWKEISAGDALHYTKPRDLKIFNDENFSGQLQNKISQQASSESSAPFQFELSDEKKISVFIEILPPEIHLIVMGFQYDIYPLIKIAKEIGWRVTVISNPAKINRAFLGIVDAVLPDNEFNKAVIDNYTAIVLMSHDYKTDKLNLKKVLDTDCNYIGILGPKVRAEKIFTELDRDGSGMSEKRYKNIYAPAGLDIGALSPEEIALSLIAEIRAVFSERQGGSLKLRETTIHERTKA
jgi:xanthine dehydrogenase accessory factor